MTGEERVAICIPTYKRPAFLRDALAAIARRDAGDFQSFVLVVDNDPQLSASPVVDDASGAESEIILVPQEVRGIASARNTLIAEANLRQATFIAFVDDDQIVAPSWLNELMETAHKTNADAVVGRRIPRYEPGIPEWLKRSRYWEEPERQTGAAARKFGTGQVPLLRLSAVNAVPGLFEEKLNLTGGEDGHFFARFHKLGFTSVWCDESVVEERIVPSRATAKWIIQREFRYGTNTAYVARTVFPSARTYAYRTIAAAGYAAVFLFISVATLPLGRAVWVRNAARVGRGLGVLAGLMGVVHREYESTHGE